MRVGVIGTGHLGREHARVYASLPGVEMQGVHDLDPQAAQAAAERAGCTVMPRVALLDSVEAVSVCVPTPAHAEVTPALTPQVLDGAVEPWLDDLQHQAGTKRTRSPGRRRAGSSAEGSQSTDSVRPMRCQPPAVACG